MLGIPKQHLFTYKYLNIITV